MNYGKTWRLIHDPPQEAYTNMAVDEALARTLVSPANGDVPTLRVYSWKPGSVSIGYFQQSSRVMDSLGLDAGKRDFALVRRPTGGSAVVHDGGPSFSLTVKNGLHNSPRARTRVTELYGLLGRCVVETSRRLGIPAGLWDGAGKPNDNSNLCVSTLCTYDVVSDGRKVAGYAARRLRDVTLLQGYITLMDGLSVRELCHAITGAVADVAGVSLIEGALTREESAVAAKLKAEKYTRREWNYKR